MRTSIILSTFLILAIASCDRPVRPAQQQQQHQQAATPKALDDNSAAYDIISKGRGGDLVESLYDELICKNSDLKSLEDKLKALRTGRHDSVKVFNRFNDKNEIYYNAADQHVEGIKDSVLRDKIKVLVAGSLKKYQGLTAGHNELLKAIETKNLTLADLYTVLKVVKTLQVMETYQRDNLPSAKPLKGYIHNQNEALKLVDTLTKE
ncbi:MAG TPA: hypothetical protein VIM87_01360 [Chitinophaga sp.]|uniref:hypothetical protein n=1 Tax=Chitinophaga sp. TaxID=1869181 RepID=UPI002F9304BC